MQKNIEKIEDVELPLGQRLLINGFKRITHDGLRKLLSCDEIQKLEDTNFLSSHPNYEVSFFGRFWRLKKVTLWEKFIDRYDDKDRLQCFVEYISLESYLHEIPIDAIQKVRTAQLLGLQYFYVAYPVVESIIKNDPVIIGLFNNIHPSKIDEYVFIAQWE